MLCVLEPIEIFLHCEYTKSRQHPNVQKHCVYVASTRVDMNGNNRGSLSLSYVLGTWVSKSHLGTS